MSWLVFSGTSASQGTDVRSQSAATQLIMLIKMHDDIESDWTVHWDWTVARALSGHYSDAQSLLAFWCLYQSLDQRSEMSDSWQQVGQSLLTTAQHITLVKMHDDIRFNQLLQWESSLYILSMDAAPTPNSFLPFDMLYRTSTRGQGCLEYRRLSVE